MTSSVADIQRTVHDSLGTHPISRELAPRARPVADLPGEALLARADELARRWAIALILARPLDGIGEIPLGELAREAPSLCAQALRALQSDVELERLTGRGAPSGREHVAPARRLAAIAGARDPAAVVEVVEALRGVLWEALIDQLSLPSFDRSSARLLGDISDRLAYVCAAALATAVDAVLAPGARAPVEDAEGAVGVPEPAARGFARKPSPRRQAVIIDERVRVPAAERDVRTPDGAPTPSDERAPERPSSWDESPPVSPPVAPARERPLSWDESPPISAEAPLEEIEIRDERGGEGPAAWIGSIGAQLERFERDMLPFAVLLVEFADIERLRREELPEELSRLAGRVEQGLAAALGGRSGSLTRERPGRCWLLAPETDRAGALRLAERLVGVVASRVSHGGTPLEVAIGTAICPDDGRETAALAAHADVGLYAARSTIRASAGLSATPMDESALPATPVDESA